MLDVGSRSIEVRVVRHNRARLEHRARDDVFGGAPLMRRNHVRETGDVLHRFHERVKRAAAGIRFIALHHAGPLVHRHRAGAGVRQQVDQHVFGVQLKDVVVCGLDGGEPFSIGRLPDRLDGLDAERFDDGRELHGRAVRGRRPIGRVMLYGSPQGAVKLSGFA